MTRAYYEVRGRAGMKAGFSTLVTGAVAVTIEDSPEIEDGLHFLLTPEEARRLARQLHASAFTAEMMSKRGRVA